MWIVFEEIGITLVAKRTQMNVTQCYLWLAMYSQHRLRGHYVSNVRFRQGSLYIH